MVLRICMIMICVICFTVSLVQSFVRTGNVLHRRHRSLSMSTVAEPVCKLEKVLAMFLSNQNITDEIRQQRFSQSLRFRKKPLPSFLSVDDELILADITAEALFCNKSIFFTNITMGSSLEVFDEEYDALSKNRDLPVFNAMLRRFYETFTGLPSSNIEIRIQNMNYLFKALIYSEARTKCISLRVRTMDEIDAMLYKRHHCGEIKPIVEKLFHEKKVKKIGAKKLKAMEEARKAAERKEKKKAKELSKKKNPYKPRPKKAADENSEAAPE